MENICIKMNEKEQTMAYGVLGIGIVLAVFTNFKVVGIILTFLSCLWLGSDKLAN